MARQPSLKPAPRCAGAALLLAASVIAAVGCGETTSTQSAAAQQTGAQTHTAASAQSATSPPAGATSTTSTQSTPQSTQVHTTGGVAHKSRAHLVLPSPGSKPEPKPTASEVASHPVADIALSSPAVRQASDASSYTLDAQYTCAGADRSPPLHWHGIPPGTKELVLFAISSTPVDDKLYFDWAVAGLDPKLTGLSTATLPPGAVQGLNGQGRSSYAVCPQAGRPENYVFLLYALPTKLSPAQSFEPAALRKQAIHIARHVGLLVASSNA